MGDQEMKDAPGAQGFIHYGNINSARDEEGFAQGVAKGNINITGLQGPAETLDLTDVSWRNHDATDRLRAATLLPLRS